MVKAVGYREYSFKDEKTGNQITGGKLTVVYPIDNDWQGYKSGCRSQDISIRTKTELQARCISMDFKEPVECRISYSPDGKVTDVQFGGK